MCFDVRRRLGEEDDLRAVLVGHPGVPSPCRRGDRKGSARRCTGRVVVAEVEYSVWTELICQMPRSTVPLCRSWSRWDCRPTQRGRPRSPSRARSRKSRHLRRARRSGRTDRSLPPAGTATARRARCRGGDREGDRAAGRCPRGRSSARWHRRRRPPLRRRRAARRREPPVTARFNGPPLRRSEHLGVGVERVKQRSRDAMTHEAPVLADVPERDATAEVRQDLGLGAAEVEGVGGLLRSRRRCVRAARGLRCRRRVTRREAGGLAALVPDGAKVAETVGDEDDRRRRALGRASSSSAASDRCPDRRAPARSRRVRAGADVRAVRARAVSHEPAATIVGASTRRVGVDG